MAVKLTVAEPPTAPAPQVTPPVINEDSPAEVIVEWVFERFAHQRVMLTTQFGMEGCALIGMCADLGKPLTVVYLDTMFFFPETYELCDRLAARYPHVEFVNGGTTLTAEEQEKLYGPQLWRTNPDLCCRIRKVEPMREVMKGVDVWLTALRRSQSLSRANIRVVDWDWKFQVLKISPFATWSREQVWEYIQANDVPYNPLHEQGYPSVGCTHCTRRVEGTTATDYSREGRWSGMGKTECGLHGEGI